MENQTTYEVTFVKAVKGGYREFITLVNACSVEAAKAAVKAQDPAAEELIAVRL